MKTAVGKYVALLSIGILAGCDSETSTPLRARDPKSLAVDEVTELEVGTPRFKVESAGKFHAGFESKTITTTDGHGHVNITSTAETRER